MAISRHEQKLKTFLDMAYNLSTLSTCARRNVGCILLDGNYKIIGSGYNGVEHGATHCNNVNCNGAQSPSGKDLDKCGAIHAEQNALMQCSDVTKIRVVIATTFPCIHCLKMLLNTRCGMIVYSENYDESAKLYWASKDRLIMQL